jgi:hypothetical protein
MTASKKLLKMKQFKSFCTTYACTIPVRNMIASQQADFIGKMIRGPPDRPSQKMITACCDHKRRFGQPQTTGKKIMVENLRLLLQDVNTVNIDHFGSLRDWINEANDEGYWKQLVKRLLHPDTPISERPKHGGRYRRGMHDMLLAVGALPIVMQTTTMMMMRTIAMMATTTADTIERVIAMNHDKENGTNLPRHRDLPLCTSNDRNLILPTLRNTIQNGGSMTRISAYKSGAACLNHS